MLYAWEYYMQTIIYAGREPGALRRLTDVDRVRVSRHFLALEPEGRRLRFNTQVLDDALRKHVAGLDFRRDLILGSEDQDGQLSAVVHLARISASQVEFSISVLEPWRGQGHGQKLTQLGLAEAAKHGYQLAHVQFMSYNHRMDAIIRHFESTREQDGTEHFVKVPLPASLARPFQAPIGPFVPSMVAFN
jgi:RimJ/RimL family protein N-acetyltransferase